jgi:hypothetical protein
MDDVLAAVRALLVDLTGTALSNTGHHPNPSSGTVREPQHVDTSSGFLIEQAEAGAGWSVDNNIHSIYLPGLAENDVRKDDKTRKRAASSALAATIKEVIDRGLCLHSRRIAASP